MRIAGKQTVKQTLKQGGATLPVSCDLHMPIHRFAVPASLSKIGSPLFESSDP